MSKITSMTVSEFIHSKSGYRGYWEYSNKNGKNSIDAREQLPEVVRKIIFAAYKVGIKEYDEHKTAELKGEVAKYHPHGDSSIEASIKGVATAYKSQVAVRILEGIGHFGSAPGDEGAAARYTSVSGTPLLTAIYRDIPFVPVSPDDTGLEQPDYISSPLPFALINGHSPIGTGKSCYIGERNAREIVEWIDELRMNGWDRNILEPEPTCVTGCKTWYEESNGYIYYEAVVHEGVDMNDLNKKGRYDVITNLPPKSTPDSVMPKLMSKLPTRATKQVIDGSGRGRPTWIVVPHGYLEPEDYNKYSLRNARKEQIYFWDHLQDTMVEGTLVDIAREWFEDRSQVVTARLMKMVADAEAAIHRIDLIKEFAEKKMIEWKSEDVVNHFVHLFPETGEEDASLVLSQAARTFLPENLAKNEIARKRQEDAVKELRYKIVTIGDVIIQEAYDVIEAQEKFFDEIRG
jgi:DNA gyrase/topoisomerase IV subunit A